MNPSFIPHRVPELYAYQTLLARNVKVFFLCVLLILKAREFLSFPFYSAITRQEEILDTDRKLFYLHSCVTFSFINLSFCWYGSHAPRHLLESLSESSQITLLSWQTEFCYARLDGWDGYFYPLLEDRSKYFWHSVLPWYVKSRLSMSKLWETISSLSSEEKCNLPILVWTTENRSKPKTFF